VASEGAKLALIASDDTALRVLAAWSCADYAVEIQPQHEDALVAQLALLAGVDVCQCEAALAKLRAIGCLRDGDISELADRLLQQKVLATTGRKPK